jgi:beta-lysine 5,6-aminomutase beta subunit
MSYDLTKKNYSKVLDLSHLSPYGDTLNDGKVQVSFTLPVKADEVGMATAKEFAIKMGLSNPSVVHMEKVDNEFSFYIIYGNLIHTVDYSKVFVDKVDTVVLTKAEIEEKITQNFDREIVVVGASTGTDAHTVGIDAIMNMKGFAGHYGLERYQGIKAYNLGSQVENHQFVKKAIELNADVLLVSQTVTQKDVHIMNLTELVEILEAENLRSKVVLIAGGARITNELAKELGYDAGFGVGKFAEDVASFFVEALIKRNLITRRNNGI